MSPLEPQELILDVQGLRLAARAFGPDDGQPILALHGWLDNAATFDKLIPLLGDGLRIVSLDLPGHGLSSGARASIDDFDDYGGCLRALQRHLEEAGLAPRPWIGVGQ
ncbi:MAG: alpha/beta fold hydrolase, partial [Bradymonadaceae bacterium]